MAQHIADAFTDSLAPMDLTRVSSTGMFSSHTSNANDDLISLLPLPSSPYPMNVHPSSAANMDTLAILPADDALTLHAPLSPFPFATAPLPLPSASNHHHHHAVHEPQQPAIVAAIVIDNTSVSSPSGSSSASSPPSISDPHPTSSPTPVPAPVPPVVPVQPQPMPPQTPTPTIIMPMRGMSGAPPKGSACSICYSHKVKCCGARPCTRCVRMNRASQCEDRIIGAPRVRTSNRRRTATMMMEASPAATPLPNNIATMMPSVSTQPTTLVPSMLPNHTNATSLAPLPTSSSALHFPSTSSLPPSIVPVATAAIIPPTDSHQSIISSLSYTGRPLAPPATAIATLAMLANPSNLPPSSLPLINPIDDDGVDAATPSQSMSPRRKRERRDDYRSEILAAAASSSSAASSSWSPHHNELTGRATTTKLSAAWAPSLPLVIPPQMVITFDESRVIRTALSRCVPWLREFVETNYDADQIGHGWMQMLMAERPRIRVCPSCTSPTQQCYACRTLATTTVTTTKPSFADWFNSSFFASLWLKKHVLLVDSRAFEAIPIAGFIWTFAPPSYQTNMTRLLAHHHRMLSSMSPASSVAAMATAMLPQTTSIHDAPPPRSTSSVASVSSTDSSTSSNSGAGRGLFDDILPFDPNKAPQFVLSVNASLEQLIGYSREELKQRIESVGWKMDIPFVSATEAASMFQNTFLSIIGIKDRWSMIAHVVTKHNAVIKCLCWGTMQIVDGYRTAAGFFVPMPGLVSADPLDPRWSE